MGTFKIQKSQIAILVLNQPPISAVFTIVRVAGDQKTELTGDSLYIRNLQEKVKKSILFYQKLFWPFSVWINFSSDLKIFANSRPSASSFKSFSQSLKQFCLTVGQNNFGNKIPFLQGYDEICHSKNSTFAQKQMQRTMG